MSRPSPFLCLQVPAIEAKTCRWTAHVRAAPPINAAWLLLDGITFRAAGS
jgi:hypothetical protein